MKQYKALILIFLFISCSKENYELNIDKDIQVYDYNSKFNGDYILKFEIQYAFLDSNYRGVDNFDEYFVYVDAGYIKNGKLTLNYNIIDEKYCKSPIEDYFKKLYNFSNSEVDIKLLRPFNISVFNHENERIGFLRFEDYGCELTKFGIYHLDSPCSGIYFIYATGETKIIQENDFSIYDLDLKKGWNIIYYYENTNLLKLKEIRTTNSRNYPNKAKWEVIMIGNNNK